MPHSYSQIIIHYIFSTKKREKWIKPDLQKRVWSYMAGVAKKLDIAPLEIGGTEDHVHMLVILPRTLSVAEAIQKIKGNTSNWIHKSFPLLEKFNWQNGYGAFSVSYSKIGDVRRYIENQREHHRKKTFQEEFIEFLKKHGIEYDERYLWD